MKSKDLTELINQLSEHDPERIVAAVEHFRLADAELSAAAPEGRVAAAPAAVELTGDEKSAIQAFANRRQKFAGPFLDALLAAFRFIKENPELLQYLLLFLKKAPA